jgi:hypothetical protein
LKQRPISCKSAPSSASRRSQGKTCMTAIYIIAGFIVLFGLLNIIEFGQVD